jgi:2,4-dienoyl-CoA reductase-like NADH-dependent reductase (Old Yellow Enzyme family)
LPVVSPSHEREAAHRAFPKKLETWDIERIIRDYADAAERMQAAGMDGVELEAYGHLMDQFWSPLTNTLDAPYGGSLDNRLRFCFEVLRAVRKRVGDGLHRRRALHRRRGPSRRPVRRGRPGDLAPPEGSGMVDFLNVVRGHIDTDAGLTDLIPVQGMRSARIWTSPARSAPPPVFRPSMPPRSRM